MEKSQKILHLSVLAGVTLLKSGAEIFRVQETMERILEAYEIHDYNVYVISNGIFATINEKQPDHYSVVRHVPLGSVNLQKIDEINQLSREICEQGYPLEEAYSKLEAAGTMQEPKAAAMVLASGLGAAGFCYLFGGSLYDSLIALVMGLVLQIFLDQAGRRRLSKFLSYIIGSMIVTLGAGLVVSSGASVVFNHIVIGSIIPLVPGVSLTTSIREFFNGDYISGSIHLIDALLTAICIALGVGAAIFIFTSLGGSLL
ncbi:MAG: threonine/serine exporter family protein [Lachnospiraceae bacterium]|jgi:uncharacterized membrane protein YjjP (DUF1212 family)|nr:threonine/serine exporter family protein [Lachnospiraceae bacterium]